MFRAVNAVKTCFAVDGWIHAPLMTDDEAGLTSTKPSKKTSDNLYAYCSFKKIITQQGCTNTGPKAAVGTKI